jgi:purine-binding chemotaxis protein CheW
MTTDLRQYVAFELDEHRYALKLKDVARVINVVSITPLPQAPSIVLGVINNHGQIIPVVNLRRRFNLQERQLELADRLIVARTPKRSVALLVDAVSGVIEILPGSISTASSILPDTKYIDGAIRLADGLILVHDLAQLLSLEEETSLTAVL